MKLWGLVWQQDLAKINVNLKLNEVENAKFYEIGAAKDFQDNDLVGWLNGRTTRDPAIFWSTQGNYRGNQQNPRGFVNEDLEKLVAAGAVETDVDKRKTHLPAAQRAGDRPVARHPGRHQPAHLRVPETIQGVKVDLNGNHLPGQRVEQQIAARPGRHAMLRYLIGRWLLLVPTLALASILVFGIITLAPGDPVRMKIGFEATPQEVAAERERLGLDKPLPGPLRGVALRRRAPQSRAVAGQRSAGHRADRRCVSEHAAPGADGLRDLAAHRPAARHASPPCATTGGSTR